MRKLKLFTLILVLIFPLTCFGQCMESTCLDEDALNELTLILEDGGIGQQEADDYELAGLDPDGVVEPQGCYDFCMSELFAAYITCILTPWDILGCVGDVLDLYWCYVDCFSW